MNASHPELRQEDRPVADVEPIANAIEDMYLGALDLAVVRSAWPDEQLGAATALLTAGGQTARWNRPNAVMPPEDIQVLGTAATPTYSTPTGPTLESYLNDATWHDDSPLFPSTETATNAIIAGLGRHAGGRRVQLLEAPGGRRFAPFTVRQLGEGKGIGLHHDLHTSLAMFKEIAPTLDTSTLISWVYTLQGPDAGGELYVYKCSPDTPDPPKKGYMWDLEAVERRFESAQVQTGPGDLFLFASARLLHRVSPVQGPRARITLGGFLALDKRRERVLYWS